MVIEKKSEMLPNHDITERNLRFIRPIRVTN